MSSKLRKAARGQPCQVMLPGVCISDNDNLTTVLAHLPSGGMATKSPDLLGAHSCYMCHQHLDGAVNHDFDPGWLREKFNEGVIRTIKKLFADGVLNESQLS